METPRTLREAVLCIVALDKRVVTLESDCGELLERLDGLEDAHNHSLHAARKPCRIPPFPQELRDIGLTPPKRKAA